LSTLQKAAQKEISETKKAPVQIEQAATTTQDVQTSLAEIRNQITSQIEIAVRASSRPVALAFLADKAQRSIGYDETIGTNWAGYGTFLNFLQNNLPPTMRVTSNQPYYVVDDRCHAQAMEENAEQQVPVATHTQAEQPPLEHQQLEHAPQDHTQQEHPRQEQSERRQQEAQQLAENNHAIRDTISQVHEHTHVPALAPSEYQIMFEVISEELNEVGLKGRQTAYNISSRAKIESVELSPEDAQFVLDIISEADPWFEKGISPPLFAQRFMNAIVARCRNNGLHLTNKEYELVAAWFTGNTKSLYHQQSVPQLDHQPAQEAQWILPVGQEETIRQPVQQLRDPYVDPFNPPQDLTSKEKELPRIFRFGSDG